MFDDLDKLTDDRLRRLLGHYRDAAGDDRTQWANRVMDWEGGSAPDVTRWHGELLASTWLEQNTGVVATATPGIVPACYRVTSAGRQALKKVAGD